MPGIIGRFITFVIFISLMLYLAGIYGLPMLGRSVLHSYGLDQAHIDEVDLQRNAITFRDIHLAATENGDSKIKTLRVEFGYSPPYLRNLTISGTEIQASWANGEDMVLAGKPIKTSTGQDTPQLTFARLLESLRLPDLPFETVEVEDATLAMQTPFGKTRLNGDILINPGRKFTAELSSESDLITLDMPVMGAFNPSTGRLAQLKVRSETLAIRHKQGTITDAGITLAYDHDKPHGKRLNLHGRVDTIAFQDTRLADMQFNIKDDREALDIKATINRVNRGDVTLNGISADISLSQIWPLATEKTGRITINKATFGVPVTDINAAYRISNLMPELTELKANFAGGRMTLKPGEGANTYILTADELALDKLASFSKVDGLSMKGKVSGRLPICYMADAGVIIDNGRISGGKGGFIHYEPETYPAALQGDNTGMATTRKALRRLDLDSLELSLHGPVGGDLEARLSVKGQNPDFSDRPVHLNLNLSGAIMRAVQQGLNIRFPVPKLNEIEQKIE